MKQERKVTYGKEKENVGLAEDQQEKEQGKGKLTGRKKDGK